MKQNKSRWVKISVLCLTVFLLSGCTSYIKDENKKAVQNTETGQNLPAHILCQPEDETTRKAYEETKENLIKQYQEQLEKNEITQKQYDSKIEKLTDITVLPKCSDFKITSGGYQGIWSTIFVKPLAWVILKLGSFLKNYGFAVIATTLLIRLVTISFTKKTALQSENMKAAQPELEKLEKKYKNRQDQESQMQKSQEMLLIYKKYNINPMSGCLFAFIQIPLFFAFYDALNLLPAIFEETFLHIQLGTTPYTALSQGNWYYLIIVLLVGITSYFSFKLNSTASMSKEQASQMKMMSNFSIVMITVTSFTLSTGIALYWITNSTFTIIQNLYVKRRKQNVRA